MIWRTSQEEEESSHAMTMVVEETRGGRAAHVLGTPRKCVALVRDRSPVMVVAGNVRGCSFSCAMAPWRFVAAHYMSLIFCQLIKQAFSLASQRVPQRPIELGLVLSKGKLPRPMGPCILHFKLQCLSLHFLSQNSKMK